MGALVEGSAGSRQRLNGVIGILVLAVWCRSFCYLGAFIKTAKSECFRRKKFSYSEYRL